MCLYLLSKRNIDTQNMENYLFHLRISVTQHYQISKTKPQTSDQTRANFFTVKPIQWADPPTNLAETGTGTIPTDSGSRLPGLTSSIPFRNFRPMTTRSPATWTSRRRRFHRLRNLRWSDSGAAAGPRSARTSSSWPWATTWPRRSCPTWTTTGWPLEEKVILIDVCKWIPKG